MQPSHPEAQKPIELALDRLGPLPNLAGDLRDGRAVGAEQDDTCPSGEPVLDGAGADEPFQLRPLLRR